MQIIRDIIHVNSTKLNHLFELIAGQDCGALQGFDIHGMLACGIPTLPLDNFRGRVRRHDGHASARKKRGNWLATDAESQGARARPQQAASLDHGRDVAELPGFPMSVRDQIKRAAPIPKYIIRNLTFCTQL
jgi:hypothetical protein